MGGDITGEMGVATSLEKWVKRLVERLVEGLRWRYGWKDGWRDCVGEMGGEIGKGRVAVLSGGWAQRREGVRGAGRGMTGARCSESPASMPGEIAVFMPQAGLRL